jgi:hypothetical protein
MLKKLAESEDSSPEPSSIESSLSSEEALGSYSNLNKVSISFENLRSIAATYPLPLSKSDSANEFNLDSGRKILVIDDQVIY